MSKIRILWNDIPRDQWDKVAAALPRCNLHQDWDYAKAAEIANGIRIHRGLIYRNQKPIGLVQGFEKRYFLGFKLIRFIRGPLFINSATPAERLRCYSGIKKSCRLLRGQLATILPELRYNEASEKSLRDANLNRIMAGLETSWLDLSKPTDQLQANLSKSWQRDIKQASRQGIQITFDGNLDEILAFQQSNYHADGKEIYTHLPPEKLIIANAHIDDELAAAALFIKHGNSATYQIGWSGDAARKSNAQKLLLWQSIQQLKEQGIRWLDLGAMDTKSAPGVTKFKQGMGGDAFILSGTYI